MLSASRNVALVLLAALALVAVGCGGSNNKGKIVGKWKITGGGGLKEEELKFMDALGVYAYFEFKDDGTLSFGAGANDPKMNEKLAKNSEMKSASCKYKLLKGDAVEIYDIPKEMQEKEGGGPFGKKDRARGNIKIEGDGMTISDDDKLKTDPLRLTKVK